MTKGIQNLGATCYFNALMQLIFRIKPLKEKIMNYKLTK